MSDNGCLEDDAVAMVFCLRARFRESRVAIISAWLCEYLKVVTAMVVNVDFVEMNSRVMRRIEGNNEVAVSGAVCDRWTLYVAALYPIRMG